MSNDLFRFKRFLADTDSATLEAHHKGAIQKFSTLYPGKRIITYDQRTLGIESEDVDCAKGYDIYELGLVDGEIPAMKCQRNDRIITYRID